MGNGRWEIWIYLHFSRMMFCSGVRYLMVSRCWGRGECLRSSVRVREIDGRMCRDLL